VGVHDLTEDGVLCEGESNLMTKRVILMAVCASLVALAGCAKTEPEATGSAGTKYTCPMHPEVVQDKQGSCPKCGMKLVEKK